MPKEDFSYFKGTLPQCQAFIAKMDLAMGYPNPDTFTTTYAVPIPHGRSAAQFIVPLKEVHSPLKGRKWIQADFDGILLPSEIAKIRTGRQMKDEGGFDFDDTGAP